MKICITFSLNVRLSVFLSFLQQTPLCVTNKTLLLLFKSWIINSLLCMCIVSLYYARVLTRLEKHYKTIDYGLQSYNQSHLSSTKQKTN